MYMAVKTLRAALDVAEEVLENEQFRIDPKDFFSAKERGDSVGTQIAQLTASLADAAQVLNSSVSQQNPEGGGYTTIISPVIMPKETRSYLWVFWALVL